MRIRWEYEMFIGILKQLMGQLIPLAETGGSQSPPKEVMMVLQGFSKEKSLTIQIETTDTERNNMAIDQSTLNKGQIRKLNALRKSVGDDIADVAFGKWIRTQSKTPKDVNDPVADALVAALSRLTSDKSFKLGTKGYVVRRAKGKGASGFVAQKVV